MDANDPLLVQEVDELTEMLRTGGQMDGIRQLLLKHGLDPDEVLLVGWMEGEEHQEYACFATPSGRLIEYEGRSDSTPRKAPVLWQDRTDDDSILDVFPAAQVGKKMAMGKSPGRET